jgi:hypothetical protein
MMGPGATPEDRTMTQIVADAEMAKQLEQADGPVPVVNDQGTVIGVCTPVRARRSPISVEELQRRRKEAREHPELGKTTAEVLAYLEQLGRENP